MEIGPIFRAMTRNKMGVGLLVLEIAFTLAIVLNCLNMIKDQRAQIIKPTGLDDENIIVVEVKPYSTRYHDKIWVQTQMHSDMDKMRTIPGVVGASSIWPIPLAGGGMQIPIKPIDAKDSKFVSGPSYFVDNSILNTLGLELIAGRDFQREDIVIPGEFRPGNVIVTEDFAKALFPEEDALGKVLDTGDPSMPDTIVGIVRYMHTPYGTPGPHETRILFYPGMQGDRSLVTYVVRTEPGMLNTVYTQLNDLLIGLDSERVVSLKTLTDVKRTGRGKGYFLINILSAVVVLLILITAFGIFGMTSFSVTKRTRQIGIRRALGATKVDIMRYFLVENGLITLIGTVVGVGASYLLNVFFISNLDGTVLDTTLTLIGAVAIILLGVLSALMPAMKAMNISPAVASKAS